MLILRRAFPASRPTAGDRRLWLAAVLMPGRRETNGHQREMGGHVEIHSRAGRISVVIYLPCANIAISRRHVGQDPGTD